MSRPRLHPAEAVAALIAGAAVGAAVELLSVAVRSVLDRAEDELQELVELRAIELATPAVIAAHDAIESAERGALYAAGWYVRAGQLADEVVALETQLDEALSRGIHLEDELDARADVAGEKFTGAGHNEPCPVTIPGGEALKGGSVRSVFEFGTTPLLPEHLLRAELREDAPSHNLD